MNLWVFFKWVGQPIKGFVYESVSYSTAEPDTIEAAVVPREGSQARCSRCGRACPTYDHTERPRVWLMPPLFKFAMTLIYTMRRVSCPVCGVVVEKVPWATGKHCLCDGFRLFLAHWARKLSWEEVALSFRVSWTDSTFASSSIRRSMRSAETRLGHWPRPDWHRASRDSAGRCSKTGRTGRPANAGA